MISNTVDALQSEGKDPVTGVLIKTGGHAANRDNRYMYLNNLTLKISISSPNF